MITEVLPPDSPLPPELQKVEHEVTGLVSRVSALSIETQQEHDDACYMVNTWMDREKQAHELVDPMVENTRKAWKAALALQSRLCDPYRDAIKLAKQKIADWRHRQKQLAAAQQVEAERAAISAAESEALARAALLERAGRPLEAEAALRIEAPVVSVAAPKIEANGVSTREVWSAEVVDLAALIRWVAEDPAARPFLEAAMPALNAQARSLKDALNIPGVRARKRHA